MLAAAINATNDHLLSYGSALATSQAMRGALVTGGAAALADGPAPAGEVVGGVIILSVGGAIIVDKAADDISRLAESARVWSQVPGEVYTLRATLSGYYPDVRNGTVYLNAGDI